MSQVKRLVMDELKVLPQTGIENKLRKEGLTYEPGKNEFGENSRAKKRVLP